MMKADYIPAVETERMERGNYHVVTTTAEVLSVENIGNDSALEIDGEGFKDEPAAMIQEFSKMV